MSGRPGAGPFIPPLDDACEIMPAHPHEDHHSHLRGTGVECSCGEFRGVTCVAFPNLATDEEWAAWEASLVCRICGERGVVTLDRED